MDKNYTTEHLICHAYNENNFSETALIQKAIDTDSMLAEQYNEIILAMRFLDGIALEPSERAINRVFKYLNSAERAVN